MSLNESDTNGPTGPFGEELIVGSSDGISHSTENSLLHVQQASHQPVPLSPAMQWLNQPLGQFVQGGIYLLAGAPGSRKSGLALQISLDLAKQGTRCLHILTEEPTSRLKERAIRMTGEWTSCEASTAMTNLMADTGVSDIESLSTFFMHNVLNPAGRYHGVRFIVLDSIQGSGLPSASLKKYAKLYEFTRLCQAAGITTLLIGHVTKSGAIQGPRDLEHNVDAVIQLCKAVRFRALAVPKNRFGPAMNRPFLLVLDDVTTNLHVSPHTAPTISVVRSYLPATEKSPLDESDIAVIQCCVSLPVFGARGKVTAPGLPASDIQHLIKAISQMPEMELSDMDFSIHAHLTKERRYRNALGLPLSMALVGSYLQRPIDPNNIYLGEVDLCRRIRDLSLPMMAQIARAIHHSEIFEGKRIFCSPMNAEFIKLRTGFDGVVPCEQLESVICQTWPEMG